MKTYYVWHDKHRRRAIQADTPADAAKMYAWKLSPAESGWIIVTVMEKGDNRQKSRRFGVFASTSVVKLTNRGKASAFNLGQFSDDAIKGDAENNENP